MAITWMMAVGAKFVIWFDFIGFVTSVNKMEYKVVYIEYEVYGYNQLTDLQIYRLLGGVSEGFRGG